MPPPPAALRLAEPGQTPAPAPAAPHEERLAAAAVVEPEGAESKEAGAYEGAEVPESGLSSPPESSGSTPGAGSEQPHQGLVGPHYHSSSSATEGGKPPLPPSLHAKLTFSTVMTDHVGSPPPYSPGASQHGPTTHAPLSVSFGPPGAIDAPPGLQRGGSSILSRAASFMRPNASVALRAFILFAITWSATMTTCLGPFFPIYMKEKFHASSMLIGLVFSVTSFSQFLACPVVAPFSHQFSRVGALKTGLLILFMGGLIFGILDHPAGFILGRILQGIGNGFVEVAGLSLLMSYSKDLKRDVGWMEGASSVGFLVGPMLGGFLSSKLGFRTLFLIMSLPNAAMVGVLAFAPRLILPRGGDPHLVDASQHSLGTSQHSVISLSSINSYKGPDSGAGGPSSITSNRAGQPPTASRRRRKAATLKRTGNAIMSSPTLPLYILIVLVVAGALGFMDTALSEHLVTALGASTFTAGLLFTIQITVYVLFSFCAGQIAHRVGRWRAVLVSTLLWSAGMFVLGPHPALAPYIHSRKAGAAIIVTTLGVLGCLETFIFLPFIPCFHHRFRARLGWRARETEDAVAAIWTTVFAMGQSVGPLIGGLLMDHLPKTRELGCTPGSSPDVPDEASCYSAFPSASVAFGLAGFACSGLLMLALARHPLKQLYYRYRPSPSLLPAPFARVFSRPGSEPATPVATGLTPGWTRAPPSTVARRTPRAPGEWVEHPQPPQHPHHPSLLVVVDEEAGVVGPDGALPTGVSHGTGSASVSRAGSVAGDSQADFGQYEHEWEDEEDDEDDEEWDDLNISRHGSILPGRMVFSMSRLQVEADEVEHRAQAALDRSNHSMHSMFSSRSAYSHSHVAGSETPQSAPGGRLRPGSAPPLRHMHTTG